MMAYKVMTKTTLNMHQTTHWMFTPSILKLIAHDKHTVLYVRLSLFVVREQRHLCTVHESICKWVKEKTIKWESPYGRDVSTSACKMPHLPLLAKGKQLVYVQTSVFKIKSASALALDNVHHQRNRHLYMDKMLVLQKNFWNLKFTDDK